MEKAILLEATGTGKETLTVTLSEGRNYTGATAQLSVDSTFYGVDPILENNSWEEIARVSAMGLANKIWNLGDVKQLTIRNKKYGMQIIGFNHDDLVVGDAMYNKPDYNGGTNKAGITFLMVDLYYAYKMHNNDTGNHPWDDCDFRVTTIPSIKSDIDTQCTDVMRLVDKYSGYNSTTNHTQDVLFIPSITEVFGAEAGNQYPDSVNDGKQYAWFANGASKIKKYNGTAQGWWTRSKTVTEYGFDEFYLVNKNGGIAANTSETQYYVVLAFCI